MLDKDSLVANLTNQNFWLRLPFMVLFYFVWKLVGFVLLVCIILQTIFQLITGKSQEKLLSFSAQLTSYGYQLFRYLSFNSSIKPFPFASWPEVEPAEADPYATNPDKESVAEDNTEQVKEEKPATAEKTEKTTDKKAAVTKTPKKTSTAAKKQPKTEAEKVTASPKQDATAIKEQAADQPEAK